MTPKAHDCASTEAEGAAGELEELVRTQREMNEQLVLSTLRAQEEAEAAEAETKELRSREEAVARLIELFRAAFDAHPVVSFVTDRRAVILEANAQAASFLKVPRESLRLKPLIGFVSRGDTRSFRAEVRDMPERKAIVVRLRPRHSRPCVVTLDVVKLPRGSRFLWTVQAASAL